METGGGRKGGESPSLLETRHRLLTVNLFIQSADARSRYLTDGERKLTAPGYAADLFVVSRRK